MAENLPLTHSKEIDDAENHSTNPTDNPSFDEILETSLSRRNMVVGSLAAAGATFLSPAPAYAFGGQLYDMYSSFMGFGRKSLIDFAPLTIAEATAAEGKMVTVSQDYEYQVLAPWGTPIDPTSGVPEYAGNPNYRPTPEEAEQQVGIGHDGMWFFPGNLPAILRYESYAGKALPMDWRKEILWSRFGMLCVNHEFGTNSHVLGYDDPQSLQDVRLSQAVHGVSVIAIYQDVAGVWHVVPSEHSRRITVNTPMEVSGPAADSPLLMNSAGNEVRGTVNNCGSGQTLWGTYMTCEENFNGYFGSMPEEGAEIEVGGFDALQDQAYERYGFSKGGFGYGWHKFDDRFDLLNPSYQNESNRFGWIVEIDPMDGSQKPVKRTALGRFKHEAAAMKELPDGRVAVYMGDDQRGDYCYKYESNRPWREAIAAGDSPLDDGKLYVAVFRGATALNAGDGVGFGNWVELTYLNPAIAAAGLDTQDKVLVYARLAADAVGATKMDRPEWTTIGTEGQVYWTLTNNDRKDQLAIKDGEIAVNEVNPIFEHKDGHIIRTDDISSTEFVWRIFILARNTRPEDPMTDAFDGEGNPLDFSYASYTPPATAEIADNTFTDPDAAWADYEGRLFIGTDGGQPSIVNAAGETLQLQDQLLVFDIETGEYKRLLMGVNNDEITGITTTPNCRTLFTNTQHPGNGDPTETNFPAPFDGFTIPRDCTIVVKRKDGGTVGS